ncbi:hypothetical protein AB0K09_20660, partial [Streptomyces sp. NPDC049577]
VVPGRARAFACLLYLSDRRDGAQFWWQFAAGAGVATAAYCLYLHHAQYSEHDMARFWYRQALALHHHTGSDLYPHIDTEPPTPLPTTPQEVIAATVAAFDSPHRSPHQGGEVNDPALGARGMFSWALDHAKIADAVCRLEAATDDDYGRVPRPNPALAAELEEHMETAR